MPSDFDPKRLQFLRSQLEEKGHCFRGFPTVCVGCAFPIGVLTAMEEEAPACCSPVKTDRQRIER